MGGLKNAKVMNHFADIFFQSISTQRFNNLIISTFLIREIMIFLGQIAPA